jgi:signal peptidase I
VKTTIEFPSILKNEKVQTAIMLAVAVVGFIAFWYGLRAAFRTEHPLMAVASGSMRDTLEVGDLIVVQGGLSGSEILASSSDADPPGDIIVFPGGRLGRPGELIVHRAVYRELGNDGLWYFKTKGDANQATDPGEVKETDVVGKVAYRVPFLGWPNLFLQTNQGKLLIVIILAILVVVEFVPFSKKEEDEQNQTKAL